MYVTKHDTGGFMVRVLIPLAEGCEELEAVTIIDLLRRAGVEVVTAGLDDRPVKASRGTMLIPDAVIDDVMDQDFDMIVLPGGLGGADRLNGDPRILTLLKHLSQQEKYTAAICAAPKVLATAGLLHNRKATAYPGTLESMALETTQLTSNTVQIDGKVVTSRGPGTAMDFALKLIELLLGVETRNEVEKPLQRPAA
jgi:4-methyl-5(b-hydroxyethyl)-thiazole monophosphate biosynthesis